MKKNEIKALNRMCKECKECAILGTECTGTTNQIWSGCIYKVKKTEESEGNEIKKNEIREKNMLEEMNSGEVACWIVQHACWDLCGVPVDMDQIYFSRQHMVWLMEDMDEKGLWNKYYNIDADRLSRIAMATLHGVGIYFMEFLKKSAVRQKMMGVEGLELSVIVPEELDWEKYHHTYSMKLNLDAPMEAQKVK